MTKVKKLAPYPKYRKLSFKVKETILTTQPKCMPINSAEEKQKFIQFGNTPQFQLQDPSALKEVAGKARNQIRFNLQGEAIQILEHVLRDYGDGEAYLAEAFGPRISKDEATPLLLEYIKENSLSESLTIHWCDNLSCSAKMMWKGPVVNCNRPDLRKYSLWINGSDDNNYMRESGIRCLMDHEIGTHFFRMLNDGLQPWFSDRAKFGLRRSGSFESKCTEEGLATINTVLRGRVQLLWGAAFAYYTACKAAEMTFKELFDHIGRYTSNKNYRWKQVMRVKRGLVNPNDLGGFGNDQCYFEGAVNILRNMETIDFSCLMSGKICYDEVDRIKRVVRKECMRFPFFMHKMASYKKTLKKICSLNGLDNMNSMCNSVIADIKFLDESKKCNPGDKTKVKKGKLKSETGQCKQKNVNSQNYTSAEENYLDQNNDKDGEALDVERFEISRHFVNQLQYQKEVAKREERSNQIFKRYEIVTNELAALDSTIEQKIRDLKNLVKEHNWSNSDSEYKQNLFNQVSCELNIDSTATLEEEQSMVFVEPDTVSTEINCTAPLQPEISYKSSNDMLYRLKQIKMEFVESCTKLDRNTNNCPSRYFKRKQQKSISSQGKQENNTHPPKPKKKKTEMLTEKIINEKVSNLKAQFISDVKPHEIIYLEMSDLEDDQNSCETSLIDDVKIDINDDITSVLPQISGEVKSIADSATGISNKEQQENIKSDKSILPTGIRKVPNFILRNKLLAKRSSMNHAKLLKQDECMARAKNIESDSDSDGYCKPRNSRVKKNLYAHIVSQYAQFKPRVLPKIKSDRETLAADMCKPFFIQAERLLQAEKVLKKTKSGCRKSRKSFF